MFQKWKKKNPVWTKNEMKFRGCGVLASLHANAASVATVAAASYTVVTAASK